jgi:phospholipid/cholesterol/gamma-HCH transport system substrate-binding protein
MKISNETKVGILTISGLTILILGFNFLKGKDIFKKTKKIYAVFNDLGSLSKSNEVKINGYVIGSVYQLDAQDENVDGIVATINLTKNVNIPKDSKAFISAPLIGASYLVIEKGSSTSYLKSGDTLATRVDNSLIDDVKAAMNPTLAKVRSSLDTLDMVLGNVNRVIGKENRDNLYQLLANLNMASSSLNGFLDKENGPLAKIFDNAYSVTDNLKKSNDSITALFSNAKQFTDKLSKLDLQKTLDSVHQVLAELKSTIQKVNSTDGTLGKLINSKELYDRLNSAILSAEILMDDLRTNPKRYVNLSLIGRKARGEALTSPAKKDSIPK